MGRNGREDILKIEREGFKMKRTGDLSGSIRKAQINTRDGQQQSWRTYLSGTYLMEQQASAAAGTHWLWVVQVVRSVR